MLLTLLLLSGSIVLVWGISRAAGGAPSTPPFSIELPSGAGSAEIFGIVMSPANVECLGAELDKVLALLSDQKLEVIRTKLSTTHTVVVDALKAPHAVVKLRGEQPSYVFVSISDNGRVVIPYTEWNERQALPWRSVSKESGITLDKCLER